MSSNNEEVKDILLEDTNTDLVNEEKETIDEYNNDVQEESTNNKMRNFSKGIIIIACVFITVSIGIILSLILSKRSYTGSNWYDNEIIIDSKIEKQIAFEKSNIGMDSKSDFWKYGLPDEGSGCVTIANDGDYYYISNPLDNYCIYQISMKEPYSNSKISDIPGNYVNILDNKVYFISDFEEVGENIGIYSMSIDGTDLECLAIGNYSDLTVVNDWIYFINLSTKHINKMNAFNRKIYEIGPDKVYSFKISENTIYYETYDSKADYNKQYKLYCMDVNGENIEKITKAGEYREYIISDGYIYYAISENGLGRISLDGYEDEIIKKGHNGSRISKIGDNIYYLDNYDDYRMNIYNIETKENLKYNVDVIDSWNISEDIIIIYYRENGYTPLVTVNDINSGEILSFFSEGV